MNVPQKWPHCDGDIKLFVNSIIACLKKELGHKLVGIYLHGSLAMGSYYRPKSDIDLIVVVGGQLAPNAAKLVALAIARKAADRPTTGNVELSVITAEAAKKVQAPIPYEMHYSSDWHEQIINHAVDYRTKQTDPDLASHLTYIVKRGCVLYGKPIVDVFGKLTWHSFMHAIMGDMAWILDGEHILESPYYSVLNICRVLQLLDEKTEMVHSKDEGGDWGLMHLPEQFHPIIQQALNVYRSSANVEEDEREIGGVEWQQNDLLALRDYARSVLTV